MVASSEELYFSQERNLEPADCDGIQTDLR